MDIISPEFIAFFTFIYERLILDNDRFVRQDTNGVLAFLLQRNRKQFKSYIVSLLGPLLLTICDPVKEVSQSAEQAFESAFPNPEKRKEIISIHLSQLFRYLKKTISTTAEDLSDMSSTSVEEADERYERVISSALLSFAKVIPFISEENIQQSVIEGFIDSRVFPMGASPRLSFRKASFQVFISICEGNPNLIASSNLRDQLFSILTSSVTSERASDVMPILLQSLVCFMKAFPTSWEKIDLSNFLFPQLKHLAETYFNLCFPALLPLISTIPHERILADSSAVLGFLQHVRTLSGSVHDQLTPLLTFAEISTFLIVKIMKLNDNLDTPTSLLYTSLSADLVSVFVELLKLGNSRPMVSLLSHLHKQSLNHHDNAFQTWDLDLSMALEQALVNAAGQGLRGDFLNYLDQIAFYYFSIAHIDYSKNTCVIQKDLGSFSSLSSLFRFARTQCGVLSGCTHKNQSEEVFLLWASVFLKMGSILLDIIHSNSELISLTLYDVHSDIQSKEVFLVLDSLFNQSRMSSGLESQCKYALKVFHELSCFIHKLSFQNSSIINDDISTLLEVVHERQSILGYVLLLKDGLITSWEQFSSFGPQVSSRSWIINCLGSTNTSVSFSTLEVALAVECQKKGLLSDCDFNSSLRVWLDLTDYFTNGNFSVPPNERIISHFTSAFILHNPSQDSQLIQEEFGLINCWESIRRLFPICDSVAPAFAWAIISQLKSILFSLIGAQLPPQEVSQKHFLYLLRDFFELVSCGYFKCLEMQEICVGLGLFDLSLWDHFYQNALSMLDTGLNNSVVDLAIAITSGFLGMRAVCLEPYLCFRILLTLGLMQHAFPAQEVGSDSINNTATSLYMLSLRNISPSCLSDLIAKTFPILRCCRHPLEVNSLLMTISNILTGESTRLFILFSRSFIIAVLVLIPISLRFLKLIKESKGTISANYSQIQNLFSPSLQ